MNLQKNRKKIKIIQMIQRNPQINRKKTINQKIQMIKIIKLKVQIKKTIILIKNQKKKNEDPLSEIKDNSSIGINEDKTDKKKEKKKEKKEKFYFYFTFSNSIYLKLDEKVFAIYRNEETLNLKIIGIRTNNGIYELNIIRGEMLR